jgi:hypothetical protein
MQIRSTHRRLVQAAGFATAALFLLAAAWATGFPYSPSPAPDNPAIAEIGTAPEAGLPVNVVAATSAGTGHCCDCGQPAVDPVAAQTRAVLMVTALVGAGAGPGILFPDWSPPSKGTYKEPAAEIGKKAGADQPWSITTMASAIEGKPVPGKPITAVGEVIDLSCYLQNGKHGDKHRDCGQKCIRNGQPAGLLTADGTIYLLMDEEHDPRRDGLTEFRQKAIDNMSYVVTINGTYTEVAGMKAIYVQGFLKKP